MADSDLDFADLDGKLLDCNLIERRMVLAGLVGTVADLDLDFADFDGKIAEMQFDGNKNGFG